MKHRFTSPLRAIIVEDEPLARECLESYLEGHAWIEVVARCATRGEALEGLLHHRPEVVFLDLEIPGTRGLDLLEVIDDRPRVLVTTAHEEFAVDAFDYPVLDYLLKPFSQARFDRAMSKLHRSFANEPEQASEQPGDFLLIRSHHQIVPVRSKSIIRVSSAREGCRIVTTDQAFDVPNALSQLRAKLDPSRFVQIHRSHVINLDHVRSFEAFDAMRLQAVCVDGTVIVASRRRSADLRRRVLGAGDGAVVSGS